MMIVKPVKLINPVKAIPGLKVCSFGKMAPSWIDNLSPEKKVTNQCCGI